MRQGIKKKFKNYFKSWMNRLPYVRTLHKLNSNSKFPAGHYYSSVVSLDEMSIRQNEIWPDQLEKYIPGINLNEKEQLVLFQELLVHFEYLKIPERKVEDRRFYFRNSYFSYGDAFVLGAMLIQLKPKKVIEIGSGFSSALMLDINEFRLDNNMLLTFIEPFPEVRLNSVLRQRKNSNVTLISKRIQDVKLIEFEKLEKGDVLFVDSTHVVKTGSDVNYVLFNILPVLKSGVIIHFHDIHYPFEYPKSWVLNGFGWNESYFLKSFLMYNNSFKILIFSDFLIKNYRNKFEKIPLFLKFPGSSLWLEKTD